MPFEVTSRVTQALGKVQKTPALAVLFDGIDMQFGSVSIISWLTLDSGLFLDAGLFLDSTGAIENQVTALSFAGGSSSTTTKLDYKIDPDLGVGDAITTMKLAFVNDKKNTILNYIDADEFLGRKVRIKMTPDAPSSIWPEDYTTIFRGIVDEISFEAGMLMLSVSHPDQKKRQTIFIEHKTTLAEAIDDIDTYILTEDASGFLANALDPFNNPDTSFERYVRIDDEIIAFGAIVGNDLDTCVRGSLGTTAVAHDLDAEISSFYVLTGKAIDLALKIMLSGSSGIYASQSILRIEAPNYVVFAGDAFDKYGITAGDYLFLQSTSVLNGPTGRAITSVEYNKASDETYVGVDITPPLTEFVNESIAGLLVDLKSKYDTLPSGLEMTPDEVDVLAHEALRDDFLFSSDMTFYLKETIENAKDFLNKEIYQPLAAYSLPKNTRASVGYTIPPLPDENIKVINTSNVKNPEKIKILRQLGRNFYNSVLYKYNEDTLENEYNSGYYVTNTDSRDQIPVGSKIFNIESTGLRNGTIVTNAANRRLYRYQFAAAQIQGLKTTFGEGFEIDIGDNIIIDGDSLMIPDLALGSESFGQRLFQVIHKSVDIKTGDVQLTVLDTNFNEAARYGYISPSSTITGLVGAGAGELNFDLAEYAKWIRLIGAAVNVRNSDFTIESTGVIESVSEEDSLIPFVSRASVGTYYNSAGIIKTAGVDVVRMDYNPALARTNLFSKSEDFTHADWQFGGTVNYTRTANATTAPDGTLTADLMVPVVGVSSFNTSCPTQNLTKLQTAKTYTTSVYVKDKGAGAVRLRTYFDSGPSNTHSTNINLTTGAVESVFSTGTVSGATVAVTTLPDGWFRIALTGTSDTSAIVRTQIHAYGPATVAYTGDGVRGIYVWGAQLEVAGAATDYIKTDATFNSVIATPPTLLTEAASTNLVTRSEDFTHADWAPAGTANYTRTANATVAPDGNTTADLMTVNVGLTSFSNTTASQTLAKAASAITYTASFFVKDNGAGGCRMRVSFDAGGTNNASVFVNLLTGVINTTSAGGTISGQTATIQSLPNDWYRVTLTVLSDTSIILRTQIFAYDSASASFLGDGVRGIYLWGAQLEEQAAATTYFATTTAAATRAAEAVTDEARIGKIVLVDDLDIIPTEGMIMELANYDEQELALAKLLYTHITDGSNDFADGGDPYFMI